MVRTRYTLGKDNLPKNGEKYFIVSNHQNTGSDPVNIMFALPFSLRISALARADLFEINPLLTCVLNWVGIFPAFRLGWEGLDGIEQNFHSFDLVADKVLEGRPAIVFPEAGHTQGHYVGKFTTGVVRMAFHTARNTGWKEDIKIVPSALHYEDFFGVRSDFLMAIGKPISLQPYYEEFQEHPNAILRTVKRRLYDSVHELMLDEGASDYIAKDYLRNSNLNSFRTPKSKLPQRLQEDKLFIAKLVLNDNYNRIIELTESLMREEKAIGIDGLPSIESVNIWKFVFQVILATFLFPLWTISLWPNAICYKLPTYLLRTDVMFTNTYRYVVSCLLIFPLCALLTLALGMISGFWEVAVLWILLWLPLGCFSWWYYGIIKDIKLGCMYYRHRKDMNKIRTIREQIRALI